MTTRLPIPKERLEQTLAHCKRETPENMAPISAGSAVEIIGALLAAHEQETVKLTFTTEHRRVIEMLLTVCGAAFELADDSCEQEIDGEMCIAVPSDAFQKLSDALDEIENSLSAEDSDRPDVFLAWSAMPRAALKSLLHPAPVPAVPECFERLLAHAQGIAMGVDWNKGTAATHHRDKLCQAVKDCAAMLNGGKS